MRNSEVTPKIKTCKSCGNPLKDNQKKLCYACKCTIEFVNKGSNCPSHKAIEAEKQIFTFGFGWLDTLMLKSRK